MPKLSIHLVKNMVAQNKTTWVYYSIIWQILKHFPRALSLILNLLFLKGVNPGFKYPAIAASKIGKLESFVTT